LAVDLLPHMNGDKAWSPEKWTPRHRLIIALHLGGDTNKEIAEKMDLSEGRVSVILNDPRAVYEVERMSQRVADRTVDTGIRLKLYANEALDEIIEELRTCSNVKVRQSAAFGILDRAGYTPARRDEAEAPPVLPSEVISRMEATTKELVEYKGIYREVEPRQKEPSISDALFLDQPGAARGGEK
jgi:transposase